MAEQTHLMLPMRLLSLLDWSKCIVIVLFILFFVVVGLLTVLRRATEGSSNLAEKT